MDGIILASISVAIVGILLAGVIAFTNKSAPRLDVNRYRLRWLAIEKKLTTDDTANHQMVVLDADKLLDKAMKERGVRGDTMGARMKNCKDTWSNANNVWSAHKLRNRIAHESDAQVTYADARRALTSFKQALKDIGAI